MDPLSSMKIEIEFQPLLLGPFEIEFELQVRCILIVYAYSSNLARYRLLLSRTTASSENYAEYEVQLRLQ